MIIKTQKHKVLENFKQKTIMDINNVKYVKRIILTFFFIITIKHLSFGQCDFSVEFSLNHLTRIPNSQVNIKINQSQLADTIIVHVISIPSDTISKQWLYSKIDTIYFISQEKFKEIINIVKKIKIFDINYKSNIIEVYNDGAICDIKYGTNNLNILFSVRAPNYKTNERNLNDFLNACYMIIKVANLNPQEIL